jgi:GntR family transcriptional regulator
MTKDSQFLDFNNSRPAPSDSGDPQSDTVGDNVAACGYAHGVQPETGKGPFGATDSEAAGLKTRVTNTLFKPTERFHLDSDSPVPLYHQVEKIILDRLGSEGAVGLMLPREMDLIKIFGVSRITIKKVADSLAAKGLIRRQRAMGTRILSLGVTEDLGRLTSYTEQMAKRGLQVSTELLDVGHHVPSAKASEKLHLAKGEKTLYIRRLRGTSEVFPVVLLQSEIPLRVGIDLKDDFRGSLYNLIEQKYRIQIQWAEEEISAARATAEEAHYLRVPVGNVVLVMERQTFASDGEPLEFVRAVYRPEHYTFSIRLKR